MNKSQHGPLKRKKESKKSVAFGFFVTVAILFGVFFGLVLARPGVTVNHLPSEVPAYTSLWGNFVPDNMVQFWFENYTAIRVYNSSYPYQFSDLLSLTKPIINLPSTSIYYSMSVTLAQPNASIAIAFVDPQAFYNFTTAFSSASSLGVTPVQVGSDTLYGLVQNDYEGSLQEGWLAVIPAYHAIAFAIGSNDAQQALEICLKVTPSSSILSRSDVRDMLYIANSTSHLAIGLQGFPGVIPSGSSTMTVVDVSGGSAVVSRIIEFNSTSTAVSQYSLVKTDYRSAVNFKVYDSFIQATEYQSVSSLGGDVGLVE